MSTHRKWNETWQHLSEICGYLFRAVIWNKDKTTVIVNKNTELLTWLSRPRRITIAKNRHDQKGAIGIWDTASGYAINAKPGPVEIKDILIQCSDSKNILCFDGKLTQKK